MEKANFFISGEGLTELARTFVEEDKHEQALQFLVDSLEGMTYDFAVSILDGTNKLVGSSLDDSIQLEPDTDAAAYREYINWSNAGKMKMRGVWYQPYAEVISYSARDYLWARETFRGPLLLTMPYSTDTTFHSYRALYNADNYRTDKAIGSKLVGAFVLWKPCPSPPVWYKPYGFSSTEEALQDYLVAKNRTLSQRTSISVEHPIVDRDAFATEDDYLKYTTGGSCRVKTSVADDLHQTTKAIMPADDTYLCRLQKTIIESTTDWIFLDTEKTVKVSRPAFMEWVFREGSYAPMSTSGERMLGDSAAHTDWILSSGIDPYEMFIYGSEEFNKLRDLGFNKRFELEESAGQNCSVLAGSGVCAGTCHTLDEFSKIGETLAVLLLPNASPIFLTDILELSSKGNLVAVIVEEGGSMAHLVTELIPTGMPIIRVPDAIQNLKGYLVEINCRKGTVTKIKL